MKKIQFNFYLLLGLAVVISSCTDLKIEETDSIFSEASGGFTGVADVTSSLDNIYNALNGQIGDQSNYYALNEVTTDELLVPTRGTDWGDNGVWRTLHTHTWSPAHGHVLNVWNQFNQNIFLCNEILDSRSNPSAAQAAEAKFIRAFSMFTIMDLYGQVPFREVDEGPDVNPKVLSRTEAFDFVKKDLTEAIPDLPSVGPGAGTNRASKASAQFLMAKLLLNARIYNGTGSDDPSDMAGVIAAVDAIAAEGFGLQAGYFDIFKEDVDNETIWYLPTSVGNRIWNTLHYNQATELAGGGWNGFTTLAEFYDTFEGDPNSNYVGDGQEERRGWVPDATNAGPSNLGVGYGFLIGQQYDENGNKLKDRAKNDLIFTKELPGLVGNNERTGIRVIKYHPVNGAFTSHEIVFRYADAHLMKAEAMMRSSGDALGLVNELRALRGASALGSLTEDDMLNERGREMYAEFDRRNDLVRFGKFTKDWEFKDPAAVGATFRNLFPIPSNALLSNPNLVQNEGY